MKLFVVGLLLVVGSLAAPTKDNYRDVISEHLNGMGEPLQADYCSNYNCCFYENSTDGCFIGNTTEFPTNEPTLVFPGGETRCIFSTSSPFAFQVWPGDKDKLLVFFQGGGACWDEGSTSPQPLCITSIIPQDAEGIFDRSSGSGNQFADYTIVMPLYCTGDMHAGNVTRPYDDPAGEPVVQIGEYNTMTTFRWIKAQQEGGFLANKFTDLVVMGASAGSVATQLWGGLVIQTFDYENVLVMPDSFIGVFPPNSQGPLIYEYGICNALTLPQLNLPNYLYQQCIQQNLTLQTVMEYWFPTFSSTPFAYLQSKSDAVQISYYIALAISVGDTPVMTEDEFYNKANAIMAQYNRFENFLVYLVDGTQHTYTPNKHYYTAGPDGPREKGTVGDFPMLDDWTYIFPLSKGETASTVCDGELKSSTQKVGDPLSPTYCDSEVYPKTYRQI
eukprot:CAMPEP_0201509432 /NCGR_PEP_ID=MMETSP0161_2-20130828/2490_1 /ASSEMBLY_ACC=CAM_ASM_000251 /TAXON_ID=180227 /ORGANISM="Neoparamoeba aestuarina, Strain SoJaBio B1-5/56/2" /LENGTH=444 /DNA_ID=CAMNT_0047904379 /DNA_START=26 /DNA_END=1360 /DNA_ORIENTATION=+